MPTQLQTICCRYVVVAVAVVAAVAVSAVVGVQLNMQTASNVSRLDRVQSQIASVKLALFISICLLAQPHTHTHTQRETSVCVSISKSSLPNAAVRRHWVANR